jgi:hypothetical protein
MKYIYTILRLLVYCLLMLPLLAEAKSVYIDTPNIGVQKDNWSCGPNSAARLLNWYGKNVTYAEVKRNTESKSYLYEYNFGTTPHILRDTIKKVGYPLNWPDPCAPGCCCCP